MINMIVYTVIANTCQENDKCFLFETTYLGLSEFHIIWEGEVFSASGITSFIKKTNKILG